MNPQRLRRQASSITAALALLLTPLSACKGPVTAEPAEIVQGDTCSRCKQPINDKRFAAEFVTKDGFLRKFDDIGCMIDHAKKLKKGGIVGYFAADYDKKEWGKAEALTYVKSQRFKTPANGGILAFANRDRAQALAGQYQGDVVGFQDLLK
jgi:copper chaperone NosL